MPKIELKMLEGGGIGVSSQEPITQIMLANILKISEMSTEKNGTSVTHRIVFKDGTSATLTTDGDGKYSLSGEGNDEVKFHSILDDKDRIIIGQE